MEKAIAAPLTGDEIIEVVLNEVRKRLKGLSPLQLNKEYAGFEVEFSHSITLFGLGSNGAGPKTTLAWGNSCTGEQTGTPEVVADQGSYKSSESVNDVRLENDLPLHVEAGDGKGGKVIKKVKHKNS